MQYFENIYIENVLTSFFETLKTQARSMLCLMELVHFSWIRSIWYVQYIHWHLLETFEKEVFLFFATNAYNSKMGNMDHGFQNDRGCLKQGYEFS